MVSIHRLEGRHLEGRQSTPWKVRVHREPLIIVKYFRTKREAKDFAARWAVDFDKWECQL